MASADVSIFGNPLSRDPSAPDPTTTTAVPRDDLDDLFNYDNTADNVFNDIRQPAEPRDTPLQPSIGLPNDLGIDEEIKVRKPRAPIARLDEERLLSEKGVPKLQRITKTRLKFRGRGHEFSDVERLLNTYHVWLDDLFGKAKFLDGLALIEKLGHKKGMQVHRRGWIEDGKPKMDRHSDLDDFVDVDDVDNDEAFDGRAPDLNQDTSHANREERKNGPSGDAPEEDELDVIMAEDAARNDAERAHQHSQPMPPGPPEDQFEDDMDALREMGDDW